MEKENGGAIGNSIMRGTNKDRLIKKTVYINGEISDTGRMKGLGYISQDIHGKNINTPSHSLTPVCHLHFRFAVLQTLPCSEF